MACEALQCRQGKLMMMMMMMMMLMADDDDDVCSKAEVGASSKSRKR
jgi:hypothetical protein